MRIVISAFHLPVQGAEDQPVHHIPCFLEFSCVLNGQMAFLYDDKSHVFPEGSVCLIPPMIEHREESNENPESIWIGFIGNALDKEPFTNITFTHSETLVEESRRIWLMARRGIPELE